MKLKNNSILKSTNFVIENSENVKINESNLIEFSNNFDHKDNKSIRHWLNDAPFDLNTLNEKDRLMFLLIFNSISFSYWGEPKWTIEYNGCKYDGSWGMIAALKRGLDDKKLILNADFLSKITKKDLAHILRGNVEIPLLAERHKFLNEIGATLKINFGGDFKNLIETTKKDAIKLLNLIIDSFPSFKDTALYKNNEILFYKRAQLFVADIYQAFEGKEYGNLKNTQHLTACADYKLPQILRKFGILVYSKKLSKKIDNKIPLIKGSNEEIEIRASTIWAVKYLEKLLESKIPYIDSIHVNDHLWLLSQNKSPDDKPYHRTRTTSY